MLDSIFLEQGIIVILLWSSSVAIVGYVLLRLIDRWFGHQVDPRVMHGLWLLLAIRMVLPFHAPDWFTIDLTPTWATILTSVWASGFLVTFFHRIRQGYQLRREILHYEVTLPEWLHHDFIAMRKKLNIKTRPVLVVTKSQHGPLLSGILRPLIAFPISFVKDLGKTPSEKNSSREAVDYILRHELCHLRGGDLWLSWLWVIARSVHWFNPFLLGAGNSLHIWRELSCDLRTLRSIENSDPSKQAKDQLNYAQILLDTASLSNNAFCPVEAAASIVEPNTEIERRITMLTKSPLSLTRRLAANSTVLVTLFLLLIFSCPELWNLRSSVVAATEDIPSSVEDHTVSHENQPRQNSTTSNTGTSTKSKDFYVLSCVDNTAESKRSIAAGGHAVLFEKHPSEGKYLEAIALFCSRYGLPKAPQEDFELYVLKEKEQKDPIDLSDENLSIIATVPVPYSKVEYAQPSWHQFPTPSIELPEGRFLIAAAFNPHQTKGVYLGIDEDASGENCKSFVGLPDYGYSPFDAKGQWMISAKLSAKPKEGQKQVRLSDAKPTHKPSATLNSKYKKVAYCGSNSDGKQSYGGSGPALIIPLEEALGVPKEKLGQCKIAGLSLWASRYGSGYNPKTMKMGVVFTDADGNVLQRKAFPYSEFSYKPQAVTLKFPTPIDLEEFIQDDGNLYIGIDPKASQYKGIYFHYTKSEGDSTHSAVLTPDNALKPAEDREWMIQCFFIPPSDDKE